MMVPFIGADVAYFGGDVGDAYDWGYGATAGMKLYPYEHVGVIMGVSYQQLRRRRGLHRRRGRLQRERRSLAALLIDPSGPGLNRPTGRHSCPAGDTPAQILIRSPFGSYSGRRETTHGIPRCRRCRPPRCRPSRYASSTVCSARGRRDPRRRPACGRTKRRARSPRACRRGSTISAWNISGAGSLTSTDTSRRCSGPSALRSSRPPCR